MSRQGQKLGRGMRPVFPFRPFRGETRHRETFRRREQECVVHVWHGGDCERDRSGNVFCLSPIVNIIG